MARKRMFDLELINTEKFLDLPISAKALYFLLGMEADDEGFITPKKVLRLYGASEDDLKILIMKKFVIPFASGVVVITDWKRNNYLDKNRIKETIYVKEKSQIIFDEITEKYAYKKLCLTNVKQMLNQYSIEENRIEENNSTTTPTITHACIQDNELIDNHEEELPVEELQTSDIYSYLESAWGRTLSPYEYTLLENWTNDEITRYAIKESVKCNARSIKYVETIVSALKSKGIKTEADAIKESNNFRMKQEELKSGRGTSKSKLEEDRERIRKWANSND